MYVYTGVLEKISGRPPEVRIAGAIVVRIAGAIDCELTEAWR